MFRHQQKNFYYKNLEKNFKTNFDERQKNSSSLVDNILWSLRCSIIHDEEWTTAKGKFQAQESLHGLRIKATVYLNIHASSAHETQNHSDCSSLSFNFLSLRNALIVKPDSRHLNIGCWYHHASKRDGIHLIAEHTIQKPVREIRYRFSSDDISDGNISE